MYLGLSFCSLDSEGCTAGLDRVLGYRALVTCELQWAAALMEGEPLFRALGRHSVLGLGSHWGFETVSPSARGPRPGDGIVAGAHQTALFQVQ